jgi:hypothetical protein
MAVEATIIRTAEGDSIALKWRGTAGKGGHAQGGNSGHQQSGNPLTGVFIHEATARQHCQWTMHNAYQ